MSAVAMELVFMTIRSVAPCAGDRAGWERMPLRKS